MRKALFFLFFLGTGIGWCQEETAVFEWQSHLPHNIVIAVEQSNDKIIYATAQAIFTLDKEDMSIDYLSKVDGLTDTGISTIAYDDFNNQLIIAYENSIIDIVSGSEVFPVLDIFNNSNFIDRKINDIFVQNEEWMYLATGFGVLQYNLQTREFGFTLDAGQNVRKIAGDESHIIIAADDGAYVLDYTNSPFPNAFSSWEYLEGGLPPLYDPRDVLVFENKILLATSKAVYQRDSDSVFIRIYDFEAEAFQSLFLHLTEQEWVLGLKDNNSSSKLIFFDSDAVPINDITSCTNRLLDVEIDEKGRVFFADEWLFARYIDESGNCIRESFRGPFSIEASDINVKDNKVYVASGGISDNFADLFGRDGVYIFEEGDWTNINQDNNNFYVEEDILQFYQIEPHPDSNIIYIGSFWAGLVEHNLDSGEQTLYTAENSSGALLPPVGDEQRTRISGLSFDGDGNLWISCFGATRPLAVLTNEGSWHNFYVPGDSKLSDLVIDELGIVWGVIGGNTGAVVAYDPGDNIKDPTDDRPGKLFNLNNSEIPSNLVNCIAKDLDGAIWVGTAQGVVVFECGSAVFENICQGNRPIVFQDDLGAFLLESEDVISIAVDGANRKWFGTRNGIFVQSANGEEEVARYNIENSPLFDNNVKAMAYNGENGQMIVATEKGIQSFRTATTSARPVHSNNVYAFPNPVRPDYRGPIAIKGLARNAEVIITDIDGQLVHKMDALGGQAIWDGKDASGREVAAGIYLVFSSSTDSFLNPDTAVSKILVIR
jgi:ligand-binding sensor domain-containing protein